MGHVCGEPREIGLTAARLTDCLTAPFSRPGEEPPKPLRRGHPRVLVPAAPAAVSGTVTGCLGAGRRRTLPGIVRGAGDRTRFGVMFNLP